MERGMLPSQMSEADIVLIPKVDNPKYMKDLRHVSLCNVLYKILSKVLATESCSTKVYFPWTICFYLIKIDIDNVMVAIENIHHMKCKKTRKVGEVALKIEWERLL